MLDITTERIALAAKTIDPIFLDTPQFTDDQLSERLGREVIVKVETANPIHSFKGRGAGFLMSEFEPGMTAVSATAGNFGQGLAYAGRRRGVPVEIFASATADPARLTRMRRLATRVVVTDDNPVAAARDYADAGADRVLVVDGKEPAVAEGNGTIGLELLAAGPLDAVVVQVGDGALINGIACWIKEHSPQTRVIGVVPEIAPAIAESWRTGAIVPNESRDWFAEGIMIRNPVPESVDRMRALVDEIVLVDRDAMVEGMRLAAQALGLLLQPAGAAGLAALIAHDLPREPGGGRRYVPGGGRGFERVATVLTGGNPRADLLPEIAG